MTSIIDQQFIEAARNNQLDELKNLLSQGADIHANYDGALRHSARNGHLGIVKFLVTQGANIHADNDRALRYSAKYGQLEVVKFLVLPNLGSVAITQGANINAYDDEALRTSAAYGYLEVVKFLLTQGADIHANDDEIFKTATKNKNEPMLMLLNAFLTEEKLLVAAVGSVALVPAVGSMLQTQRLKLKKLLRSKI